MKSYLPFIFLSLLFHFFLLSNLRFIAWPEMLLWPYLLNHGLIPYQDIVIVYSPGLILGLGLLGKIFGITLLGLKIYTWITILLTDLLVFLVSLKISGEKKIALFSLLFFVFWQPYFEGNALWFDLILAPLALLSFYFLITKKLFLSGLFIGLALSVKQTAFWFIPPVIASFYIFKYSSFNFIKKYCFGLSLPVFAFAGYLLANSLFSSFWKWAVDFGIFYLPKAEGQVKLPTIKQLVSLSFPYFSILLTPIYTLGNKGRNPLIAVLSLWTIFGLMGTFSRWEYFHFQPSLPFLSILSACLFFFVIKKWPRWATVMIILVTLSGSLFLQQRFYKANWQIPDRFYEKDILILVDYLKKNVKPQEKIYVLNSWDHIYALSETLPAVTPLIHTLPWHLEYPGMQDEYVKDLAASQPRIVIKQPYSDKGLGSYKPIKIDQYLEEHYTLKETIEGRFQILESK